jgi:hypothetical protein
MPTKPQIKTKSGSAKVTVASKRGKGMQPEAAVLKGQKPRKVTSLRVSGAQRSTQQRQQKKRDSR